MPASAVISVLARSLLAGEPAVEDAAARGAQTLGHPWQWLRPLAERYVTAFAGRTRPRHRDVVRFLQNDDGFQRAWVKHRKKIAIAEWIAEPRRMLPVDAARRWGLPVIETTGGLADWLGLYPGELEWFADVKRLGEKSGREQLQHYRYRVVRKRTGGVRVLESPKANLKSLQRRILTHLLDRVPVHPAAHGFVKGHSIVTFTSPHCGSNTVMRMDLDNFFPAFPAARVQALFRMLGYPEEVAARLAGICTNAVPSRVWVSRPADVQADVWNEARMMYRRVHLAQGAPTSPALANAMAYRLDCRLAGLALAVGAVYTRYADDLAFSGDAGFGRAATRFSTQVAAIALEEGFAVNHHKTRVMGQGVRQELAGVVVNRHTSLRREEFEKLEAILTNCVRLGPASQNRAGVPDFRAHLEGRVSFLAMVNPGKGERLRKILHTIRWESGV